MEAINHGRKIGIRHRVKATAAGEARPTQVCVMDGDTESWMKLETADDELDWVLGRLPVTFRPLLAGEEVPEDVIERHVKTQPIKKSESADDFETVEVRGKTHLRLVPETYTGLMPGDQVLMSLGGSGNVLAGAISARGAALSAHAFRVPPKLLMDARGTDDQKAKDKDPRLLIDLFDQSPEHFYQVRNLDRSLITINQLYRLWAEAQEDRMKCEKRLRQLAHDEAFRSVEFPDGPIGDIEAAFKILKANNATFKALLAEERRLLRLIKHELEQSEVYQKVLAPIEGMGPSLSARLISAIGDLRRFIVTPNQVVEEMKRRGKPCKIGEWRTMEESYAISEALEPSIVITNAARAAWRELSREEQSRYNLLVIAREQAEISVGTSIDQIDRALDEHRYRSFLRWKARKMGAAKFCAYCGVHVLSDGTFARKRTGQVANWSGTARQALYLFGDQMVKRPSTEWGKRLKATKARMRERHPVTECSTCKKPWTKACEKTSDHKRRYSDGHIHKMAMWRTRTRFAEHLFREWLKVNQSAA